MTSGAAKITLFPSRDGDITDSEVYKWSNQAVRSEVLVNSDIFILCLGGSF